MKAINILSIIGIVLFSVSFLSIVSLDAEKDFEAAVGLGGLAILYGLGYSISALVLSKKSIASTTNNDALNKPVELKEKQAVKEIDQSFGDIEKFSALKDKGLITADEFEAKKKQILGL